jgi:hypothetical protein
MIRYAPAAISSRAISSLTASARIRFQAAPRHLEQHDRAEQQERLEALWVEDESVYGLQRRAHQIGKDERQASPRALQLPGCQDVHWQRARPDGQGLQDDQDPDVAPQPVERGE